MFALEASTVITIASACLASALLLRAYGTKRLSLLLLRLTRP